MGMTGSIFSAMVQSTAERGKSEYLKQQASATQRINEIRARDAIKRGDKEAQGINRQAKTLIGAQRAAMAAQGIDVSDIDSTAGELQQQVAEFSAEDAMTIRNNAWREAWGIRTGSKQETTQLRMQAQGLRFQSRMTLIAGGLEAVAQGQKMAMSAYGGGAG